MTKAKRNTLSGLFALYCLFTLLPSVNAAELSTGEITRPLSRTSAGDYALGLTVGGQPMKFVMRQSSVVNTGTRLVNIGGYPESTRSRSFQGVIQNQENSWVRVSIHGDALSGVMSNRGTRYQLSGSATGFMTAKLLSEQSSHNLRSHASQLRQTRALTPNKGVPKVTHVVDIAVAVDSQYNALHNGRGLEKALSIINSVDGIYREEFGIAVRVITALNVTERDNDPFDFGNVPIELMLRGLRGYRMRTSHFNGASLVHLFTGNQNSDAPVGLAWIDTACRTDGYDVGLSTPYQHEVLLAAHEIAHNLGAKHDSDTACRIENNKVMWPYISSHTSQNFSSCTTNSVRQSLENSCHIKTLDLQVSLTENDERTYTATVTNNDLERTSPSSTLLIGLPENTVATTLAGDCIAPDSQLSCAIGALLPGAENQVRLNIENFNGEENQTLVASINPNDTPDLSLDNNVASIYKSILPDAEPMANEAPLADFQSGGGANSGILYPESGIGSTGQSILALGLIALATRRRRRFF